MKTVGYAVQRVFVGFDLLLDLFGVAFALARLADVDLLADRQVRRVETFVVFHQYVESYAVAFGDRVGGFALVDGMDIEQTFSFYGRKAVSRTL